ncbi:MAG: Cytochrome c551 peroxidase [Candidatus Kapaibacterium sp.]|nr:MAG: Cytochrome c551 peroxidase [Candidatus Kapabacteria bacterium]
MSFKVGFDMKRKRGNIKRIWLIFASMIFLITSCTENNNTPQTEQPKDYSKAPKGFPPIPFPADNPYSKAKFELGRRLFYDSILVKDYSFKSCSHCLKQAHNFQDNVPNSLGYNKIPEPRNTMSLTNVAYFDKIFWDGRGKRIEQPAYRSLFLPYIFATDTNELQKRLENHPIYPKLFKEAFGDSAKPTAWNVALAISTFVRCLVSGNSPYDKYVRGDTNALTESQKRGMKLFFSERTKCSVCHSGFLFTDLQFHNTGTTNHYFDFGRYYVTGKYEDRNKFLTPSLRNVEVSAPYLHDGTYKTLEEVIENYNRGGFPTINKDTLIKPLNLTDQEKQDLINFLKALTDWEFLTNPDFAEPK